MPDTLITISIAEAAAILREGGTVAFPTETVYGLGASALDPVAVGRVFAAKGRPADNPLIVHMGDEGDLEEVAGAVPEVARALVERFFPGPLTLVLPRGKRIPHVVSAGLDTVAVRMPAHPQAQALIRAAGVPLVAPSANRSGRPSPTTWEAVREDLDGRIDAILKGAPTAIGLESTVVDVTGVVPVVLRTGAVSLEELQQVAPATRLYGQAVDEPARSPGMRHRHYAPNARVTIVQQATVAEPGARAAWIGLDEPPDGFAMIRVCVDEAQYAHHLFDFFRRCDEARMERIYAQAVPETGLGRALMDRLRRAAEGQR